MRSLCAALLPLLVCPSAAQSPAPSTPASGTPSPPLADGVVPGHRFSAPPSIDGVVDLDGEWAGVPGGSGAFDDQTGEVASEGMRFWLGYDDKYVYFAAILDDSEPGSIRAVEYRTNASLGGDDHVELQIDPFGNFADGHRFRVNPRGATDFSVPGGRANKREWQGEFVAAGRITGKGWEVEARIPWAVMRLPTPGQRDLRINLSRELQRLNREFQWRDTTRGKTQNTGTWAGIEIPKIDRRGTVLALPYAYAGFDRDGHSMDAGVDLKTQLTDQIDGVLSINPDFRNVENRILSLDFSYFERLAGESRPFFLEGQNFFGGGHGPSVFASQRIGHFDLGAKAFGRLGEKTSIAVLDAVDFGDSNSFVGRVSQSLGDRASAQASFVSDERGGNANTAGEVGFFAGSGTFAFYGGHMATRDPIRGYGYRHNGGLFFDDGIWEASLNYSEVSPDLYPRAGYAPETDYKGASASLSYKRQYEAGPMQEIEFGGSYMHQTTVDGEPYRKGGSISAEVVLREGAEIQFRASRRTFRQFDDRTYSISVEWPRGNPYNNWDIDYSWGNIEGADYQSFGPSFSYRPSERLQVRGSFEYFDRGGSETQTVLSANYDFDEYQAVAARLVQRDADVSFYLAFRKSGNTGNEYFLIIGDPNSQKFRPSLILKASFPLEFRF